MMKRTLLLALLLIAPFVVVDAVDAEQRQAPDFTFEDINPASETFGKKITLSEAYAEEGVVLNFLASWCGYCWKELPYLQEMSAAGEANVVGVAADEYGAPPELVLSLVKRAELTIPILWVDEQTAKALEADYAHQMLPATYLIDAEGMIVKLLEGAVEPEQLRSEIARALN